MAPRRATRNNNSNDENSNNNNNNNGNISNVELVALVAQQIAAVVPSMVVQIIQALGVGQGSRNSSGNVNIISSGNVNGPPNHSCTLKYFISCGPTRFSGDEGATGLLQWFESIENTFLISECPEHLKVRYAMSVLQKRALTWWNGVKRNRGVEATLTLPWEEVKALMLAEFCPRNEMIKLEEEFWKLKQDSGENLAYTTRFHELSLLVPHHVTPVSRKIERYISGLPMQIQDAVWASRPTVLEDAIHLAALLTDNHVKAGTLFRKRDHRESSIEDEPEPSTPDHKRKTQYLDAIPITQVPPAKKPYENFPQCNTCKRHHPPTSLCRSCTNCGKFGHLAKSCRKPINHQQQTMIHEQPTRFNYGQCFACGDPNHYRDRCPNLIPNQAPPATPVQTFAITATEEDDTATSDTS